MERSLADLASRYSPMPDNSMSLGNLARWSRVGPPSQNIDDRRAIGPDPLHGFTGVALPPDPLAYLGTMETRAASPLAAAAGWGDIPSRTNAQMADDLLRRRMMGPRGQSARDEFTQELELAGAMESPMPRWFDERRR